MGDYYIVSAISSKLNQTFYISNTSPILWTNDKSEAKIFESFRFAKHELEDNFISLSYAIMHSNIESIWILEFSNNIEIGKEKFI